jgi:D-glycero-alpha-D-manno-heptose-7-phosphate kinase
VIITQTPLRISFLGGGTDFPAFYAGEPGGVVSSTIDKYIFVILKYRFDDLIRVGYTRTEMVDDVVEVEHDLVREALRITGIEGGVEVATMADIPSRGSGLGSSSSVSVALLHAMWAYRGVLPTREQLARGACEIEIERLGRPIGKQDQYAAAYGGLRYIAFEGDEVRPERLDVEPDLPRRLGERLMLFFTGIARQSSDVLAEQEANIEARRADLRTLARLACHGREALMRRDLDGFGALMHEGWQLKRGLASRVTNDRIDAMYGLARAAGAIGGKISGAGGGGFLLLYTPPERQEAVRAALHGLSELEFGLEPEGSLVMLNSRRR